MAEAREPEREEPKDIYQLEGEERNDYYMSKATIGGSSATLELRPSTALPRRTPPVDFRKMPHQKKAWQATSTPSMWGSKVGLDLGIVGHRANVYQTVVKIEYPEIAIPPTGKNNRSTKEKKRVPNLRSQALEEPEWFGESISQRSARERVEPNPAKKLVPALILPGNSGGAKVARPGSAAPVLKSLNQPTLPAPEMSKPAIPELPIIETGAHLEGPSTVPVSQ